MAGEDFVRRTVLKRLHLKRSLHTQGRSQEGGLNETDEFGTDQHLGVWTGSPRGGETGAGPGTEDGMQRGRG